MKNSSVIRHLKTPLLLTLLTLTCYAVDEDGDGMSDVWQRVYNIATGDGASDPDGDGKTNAIEALSGTDPHDPTDFFKVTTFTINPPFDTLDITWRSLESRTYRIDESRDLLNWTLMTNASGGQGLFSSQNVALPHPPSNNNFESRLPTATTGIQTTGSNADSSLENNEPLNPSVAGSKSVWWTWRASSSGEVTITTAGSSYDTTLAVYSGESLATLALIGSNDDAAGLGTQSSVTFTADPALVYSFQVNGYSGITGSIVLNHPASAGTFPQPVIPSAEPERIFFRVDGDTNSDLDQDGDSLLTWEERLLGTDPYDSDGDTDNDGMSDLFEFIYEFDPLSAADAALDADTDGLTNAQEASSNGKLNPRLSDTNGNGISDADEDSDYDGLTNAQELQIHLTDPFQPDTDNDGLFDGWEIANGFSALISNLTDSDPNNDPTADPDNDGLNNSQEADNNTKANDPDSDGDGVNDGDEVTQGSNPNDPNDSSPPPNGTVPVNITFGDDSGSHSEKYRVRLIPLEGDSSSHTQRFRTNRKYGAIQTDTLHLPRGSKYSIELIHVATKPEFTEQNGFSNYDWTLNIDTSQGCLVMDDPDTIITTVIGWPNSTFQAEGKSATLYVPLFEWITPKESPVTKPDDAGDGQNEFTYNAASPGVLTLDLKVLVKPTGTAAVTGHDGVKFADRCIFTLPNIAGSTFAWDAANNGGKSQASGEYLIAKATYTALPSNNSGFGLKQAEFKCDSHTDVLPKDDYEVFFMKGEDNHPELGPYQNGRPPNWFLYWRIGGVCGIPATAQYDSTADFGYTRPGTDTILRLGPDAPTTNTGPETYTGNATYGSVTVTGQGKGIQCVAETVAHEVYHLTLHTLLAGRTDGDSDGIANADEPSLDGINSNPSDPDTFNMGGGYSTYGDNEIRCRNIELTPGITVYPKLDWANPGAQSKNQFGPTP